MYISDDVDDQIVLLEMINNVDWVDDSVEIVKIVSVVDTNEPDCSFVQGIIEFNISEDDDDENELIEMVNNVYWVDISLGNGEIFPVVDTNEIDCSFVEEIFEVNISDDVDDQIVLLEMINNVD